jgi:hypothetical protein
MTAERAALWLLAAVTLASVGSQIVEHGRVRRMEQSELARQARDRQERRLWEAQLAVNQSVLTAVNKLAVRAREPETARR